MKKLILLLIAGLFVSESAFAQEEPPTPLNLPPIAVQSLFVESVRNQQFEEALNFGRWLVDWRPREMENNPNFRGDRNFRRMIQIYEAIGAQQSDPSLREAYIDSVLIMYERTFITFDESEIDKFEWKMNRARFMQSNMRAIDNGRVLTMEEYNELFEKDMERFIQTGDGYFINYLVSELVNNGFRDRAIQTMNVAEPLSPESVRAHFNQVRADLFSSPDERIEFLLTQMDGMDEDEQLETKQELFDLYGATGNREKQREMAITLYEVDPSYANIMRLAEYAESQANYRDAIRYLGEAFQATDDPETRAMINLKLSENHFALRDLQTARTYAQRAMRLRPNWGAPLMRMADIYAQAVTDCASGGLERTDKAVYWLVIDYLERARRVDSSVANTVQRSIASFQAVTPNAEEKFYMNWENGDTIQVGANLNACYDWISESTTVR
ncbi:hypothetical protein CYPRO_0924 [Cyclonatronum proteinivorum]|uniref:Tetratricopeptide repeat-containing protein n=1 Tax=Cyclonatronum proteinivorum TaxID=1457365 RepID=A0A345UI99_9BACT|nr:hypothetical protein [Cyclonatronum proteinivorum]AXJ00201.1 hypothetical protein CYPRO_0924 [Cyclonatronum proteinivorum]